MKITTSLFEAALKCSTKCFLRSLSETGKGNAYADWVRTQAESYRGTGIKGLTAGAPHDELIVRAPGSENLNTTEWRLVVDVMARAKNLESSLHAVERIPANARGQLTQIVPIRFIFTNKLTRDDKLLLAFDGLVLSEMLGHEINFGKIVHSDSYATLKVRTSVLTSEVRQLTRKIAMLLSNNAPPDLALNRHCPECEFQVRCRQKATEKDDLSLLSRMTEKERKKFTTKGLFTVTQLSYTFRPRRRPKRLAAKREKYHHSLKALAIRERKIYIVGSPELKIEGTPVFLDVEGIPDRDFYYLIGVRIKTAEGTIHHSLWADKADEEETIWTDFLRILSGIENPLLIHYGSFETTFMKRMCDRYGEPLESSVMAKAVESAVNLLSLIFRANLFPHILQWLKGNCRVFGIRLVRSHCFRCADHRLAP